VAEVRRGRSDAIPQDSREPEVEITRDGPYRARGLPLVRMREVIEDGIGPVAWERGEPIEADPEVLLCRCGRSATKPFCDDSHLTNGFDGTETADRAPTAERQQHYEAIGITVNEDASLCAHAGFCATVRAQERWQTVQQVDDPDLRAELVAQLEACPSGTLTYTLPEGLESERPHEPEIAVVRDGPLWLRGGVRLVSSDGFVYEPRGRVALCRCGRSENKPFCDGSHKDAGFTDG
jgi:CDGSH-type Zn-finger protein